MHVPSQPTVRSREIGRENYFEDESARRDATPRSARQVRGAAPAYRRDITRGITQILDARGRDVRASPIWQVLRS